MVCAFVAHSIGKCPSCKWLSRKGQIIFLTCPQLNLTSGSGSGLQVWRPGRNCKFSHPTAFPTGIEYFRDKASPFTLHTNINLWCTHTRNWRVRDLAAELPRVEAAPPRPGKTPQELMMQSHATNPASHPRPPRRVEDIPWLAMFHVTSGDSPSHIANLCLVNNSFWWVTSYYEKFLVLGNHEFFIDELYAFFDITELRCSLTSV